MPELDCNEMEILVMMKVDGCLDAEGETVLSTHLQTCEVCRKSLAFYGGLDVSLEKFIQGDLPAGLDQSMRKQFQPSVRPYRWLMAAAIVMLALFLSFSHLGKNDAGREIADNQQWESFALVQSNDGIQLGPDFENLEALPEAGLPGNVSLALDGGGNQHLKFREADVRLVENVRAQCLPDGLNVFGGQILCEITPGRKGGYFVRTPLGTVTVKGTVFGVLINREGLRVHCRRGRVEVAPTADADPISLTANQWLLVNPQGHAGPTTAGDPDAMSVSAPRPGLPEPVIDTATTEPVVEVSSPVPAVNGPKPATLDELLNTNGE